MPLNSAERFLFEQSLHHPLLFRHLVRPGLYRRSEGDPERVHDYVLGMLNDPDAVEVLRSNSYIFDSPWLEISLNGQRVRAMGTAAGLDKDGDALKPLSLVYGFQEPGTVIVSQRRGNDRPTVAVGNADDLYNAQGFPSEGMNYFLSQIRYFRKTMPDYPIYVSECGLPLSEENAVETALAQMKVLLTELDPYVQGHVWNPFSPNTDALKLLRTPEAFREHAGLMARHAPDKLRLVKMGPYEGDGMEQHLRLTEAFLDGGGHGIVGPNTKMVPKEQVPSKRWGYKSAGRSGAPLKPYRLRMTADTHQVFPEAVIFACGGIFDGDDAYETFKLGATALESYTPETFYGPGLVARKQERVVDRLMADRYDDLEQLQEEVRNGRKLLCDR
ncbi:MAG: hypothetical protein HYT73_00250 [Candidatus Aenigmarchaeota archaeon]|nr:hypothetical protein [Candidatus Aenigmarchaeota archaeon]